MTNLFSEFTNFNDQTFLATLLRLQILIRAAINKRVSLTLSIPITELMVQIFWPTFKKVSKGERPPKSCMQARVPVSSLRSPPN